MCETSLQVSPIFRAFMFGTICVCKFYSSLGFQNVIVLKII